MPLDLRGFMDEPNQWAGLYHAADMLEKRKLQENQLALQKEAKRNAAGTFLQNYLDPKDMLTGTDYDPVLLKSLDAIKQQGAKLAMAGADAPTLMMALGPSVNKLSTYSTNAKNINKRIDEQLKGMKESGIDGYNFAALKQEALKNAFYKEDENGQQQLDPTSFDPSQDYVAKAIQKNPLAVTNPDVFDEFAKKAEKQTTSSDVTTYTPLGTKYRSKANLIAAGYMTPEIDKEGVMTGFVPKHDIATEQGQPLFHTFDKGGQQVREPVRLLDEQEFDKGLKPAMQDRIRGMVQEHLKEYTDKTGRQIDINSPQAKLVGRAIAYDMLNVASRNGGTIQHIENKGQPSSAMINLRVGELPESIALTKAKTKAAKEGRLEVSDPNDLKYYKRNVGQVFGDIFTGKEDLSSNDKTNLNGTVYMPNGQTKTIKDRQVIDITGSMPGGGLKSGRGEDFKFKGVFFDPKSRSLLVDEVSGPEGNKTTKTKEIPEANIGQFLYNNAEANGIPKAAVRKILDEIGYKNGSFSNRKSASPAAFDPAADFNDRTKGKPWGEAVKNASPFSNPFQSNQ